MRKRIIREVATRIAAGVAAALLITWVAYRFHFNLSSATSVHLFLVTAIALRWGFFEASVVSLLSVACLDYFFTQPLFDLYMVDSRDFRKRRLAREPSLEPGQPSCPRIRDASITAAKAV